MCEHIAPVTCDYVEGHRDVVIREKKWKLYGLRNEARVDASNNVTESGTS